MHRTQTPAQTGPAGSRLVQLRASLDPKAAASSHPCFAERLGRPWTLTILPLRADAPIYLDDSARAKLHKADQVAALLTLHLVPEYQLEIRA